MRTISRQGDGRFDVTWSRAAGENPVDLAIADLDGDGLADEALRAASPLGPAGRSPRDSC